jgi:hypothetical protein
VDSAFDPSHWSIEDLEAFILSKPTEEAWIEFKDSRKLLEDPSSKELSIDVSSFANANGGHIFYGVCEDKNNHASHVDGGIDTTKLSLLTLEHRIRSNIRPSIPNVKVSAIRLRNGNAVIVVSIPNSSPDAPHQAKDGRYYGRRQRQRTRLEDYEIRDIMRRRVRPRLVVDVRKFSDPDNNLHEIVVSNQSSEVSIYNILTLYVPKFWNMIHNGMAPEIAEPASYVVQGATVPCKMYTWKLLYPSSLPLFKEIGELRVCTIKIERVKTSVAPQEPEAEQCIIPYSFACPGHKVTGLVTGTFDPSNGWVQSITSYENGT